MIGLSSEAKKGEEGEIVLKYGMNYIVQRERYAILLISVFACNFFSSSPGCLQSFEDDDIRVPSPRAKLVLAFGFLHLSRLQVGEYFTGER